jgi:hypothetical protein
MNPLDQQQIDEVIELMNMTKLQLLSMAHEANEGPIKNGKYWTKQELIRFVLRYYYNGQ